MPAPRDVERCVPGFVGALVARDLRAAGAIVAASRAEGVHIEELYTELFAPSLHHIGELWATGEISIAQEHLAMALVQQLMATLYPEVLAGRRASRERVLVAAPKGERHVIGLQMLADILEGRGFDVTFLGADTTRAAFEQAVERHTPRVAVLAAYTARSAAELAATAGLLLGLAPRLQIVAGGASDAIHDAVDADERVAIVRKIGEALPVVELVAARRATHVLGAAGAEAN